jgi:ATP synthase protein I
MGEGYRLLGELIGGLLGGLGLGWVVDYFAHTTPFGMVIGLLLGTAASTYLVVKSADAMGKRAAKKEDRGLDG